MAENRSDQMYTEEDIPVLARDIVSGLIAREGAATVIALEGELGAGKTTLTQEIAKVLGVLDPITSPTFVVMKRYLTKDVRFPTLIHMDAYRIEDERELLPLHFSELLSETGTLIIIEWPEKIQHALPSHKKHYKITHAGLARLISEIHA